MKKLGFLLLLAALIVGGWLFASPWLAMKGLAEAAQARDLVELEERIDFPVLRENARADVEGIVDAGRGDVLGSIAELVVDNVGGAAVDVALTPRGVASMIVSGAFVVSLLPERLRNQQIRWDVEREGLNSFRGVGTFDDGTAGPVLLFERRGISWQVTDFELPQL